MNKFIDKIYIKWYNEAKVQRGKEHEEKMVSYAMCDINININTLDD